MDIENIIISTGYLEFVNNIDSIIFEVLYGDDGYCLLSSKDAVINAGKAIEKFNREAQKAIDKSQVDDYEKILNEKKNELEECIRKHYLNEVEIWAEEVFESTLDNCILSLSIDKDKKDIAYHRGLCAISWICEIKNYNQKEQDALVEHFRNEFISVLNEKNGDFLQSNFAKCSDYGTYLKLRNKVVENSDEFINTNLEQFSSKLSAYDMSYFKKVQNDLLSYKKTSVIDEFNLINCAICLKNLKNDEEKYKFIKEIMDDFSLKNTNVDKISENDKIEIIKRRMKLFSTDEKADMSYFKEKLTSLNEK